MNIIQGSNGNFITLTNKEIQVTFCDVGASIVSLYTKDRCGNWDDIVLGYQSAEEYYQFGTYFGAVCGRCANRINHGKFELNKKEFQLDINNGDNHLHGGLNGANQKRFSYEVINPNSICFSTRLRDGESGYPGNADIKVTYTLKDNELIIDYYGVSDQDTLMNLTNHSYFNLNGHDSGNILEHLLTIHADYYVPINERSIPLGKKEKVEKTPFDFRVAKEIGRDISNDHPQLINGKGYDHSFCVEGLAAKLTSQRTGRSLEIITTCEGLQVYTGNYISNVAGKTTTYNERSGIALETQYHPDAINQKWCKKPILLKGDEYKEQTILRFFVEDK